METEMTERPLRSRPHMPANNGAEAQSTTGPAVGVLRLACGRPGPVAVIAGLGALQCAMVGWSFVAPITDAQQALVLGAAIAHTVGVQVVLHQADREVARQRGNARAAAAHARYQASRRRAEEQRSWELVDRIVSLEDEVRTVRSQADQWTTAVLSQVIELQRQLQGDEIYELGLEPRGRHARSTSSIADIEPRCDRATRKKE
jgi:hypothetical protein